MWKPRSLAWRVALSMALGALSSGTVIALVTGLLSDRLLRDQEDRRLRDAAETLAYELEVKKLEPAFAAMDETRELAHTGISIAVFERAQHLAGQRSIPYVDPGACRNTPHTRVCAVAAGPWVVSAARDRALMLEHRQTTTHFASFAVMLTSLLSSLIALLLVRRAVDPLARLARAVQRVPASDPAGADLGSDEGVAEVDALRKSLRSAFDRLGRALDQSHSFAANAAHQLRTPLTTVIGELELALEHLGSEGRDEVARAHAVSRRLSVLLDRLLILARPDERLQTTAQLHLLDAIEDAIAELPEPLRQRVHYEGPPVQIRADPALVVSAIMSSLDNALKYSAGPVRVLADVRGELACVVVEDEGPGIAEAEREQVFAPFYRGRQGRTGHAPGHGIGLALIARVTALHGGTARFVPRARGACLEMTFMRG